MLRDPPASLSLMLGLKACATAPGFFEMKKKNFYFYFVIYIYISVWYVHVSAVSSEAKGIGSLRS